MPLTVQCPQGHKLSVAEKYAGKRVKCPKCASAFQIPELSVAVVPAAIAPPTESLDFSDSPADPFAQPADPFAQLPSNAMPLPAAPQPYYRPAVAPKENKKKVEEHIPLSMDVMYLAAGVAFVASFALTLVLGFAML